MSRYSRWNRFRWRRRPSYLKPLRGKPFNNIPKWCYERNKKMKESPLSNKTRTVKEKDINTGYLSRVLTSLVSTLNEAIRWISRIPPLEHKVEELEKEVRRLRLAVAANTAIDLKHRKDPYSHSTRTSTQGRRYEKGGVLESGKEVNFLYTDGQQSFNNKIKVSKDEGWPGFDDNLPGAYPSKDKEKWIDAGEIPLDDNVNLLYKTFSNNGFNLSLRGGAVRDHLLGEKPKDFDLSTDANLMQTLNMVDAAGFNIYKRHEDPDSSNDVILTQHGFGGGQTIVISKKDSGGILHTYDINMDSPINGWWEEQGYKDFTINSLAYDIERKQIYDSIGAIDDIENKIVRAVGNPDVAFRKDPRRKLKAIRFASKPGFVMENETSKALRENNELNNLKPVFIRFEYDKGTLGNRGSYESLLKEYDMYRYLQIMIPGTISKSPTNKIKVPLTQDSVDSYSPQEEVRQYQRGGKTRRFTKPKPLTKSQRKKLISSILSDG